MASFDIVCKPDVQLMDNAVNTALKEIQNRFDFKNSQTTIELNKKDLNLLITTEDDMRLKSTIDVLHGRMIKQKLDTRVLDETKEHYPSGVFIKKEITVKQGIDKETAKKIIADIKNTKLKVTSQIMDDVIRVTGKNIDDLQKIIQLCNTKDYGIPLQHINMKR